jgi:VWFA-related protein
MGATRRRAASWAGCLLGLLAVAPAAHQEEERPVTPAPTFPVASLAVNVYAVVTDREGHLVSGLSREDFELREDGVPQALEHFAQGTGMPLSLGMLIDTSPSQAGALPAEREEAQRFLSSVLGPGDQAFVMRFDLDVELLQSFTGEMPLLTRAIDRTRVNTGDRSLLPGATGRARGGTRLHDALYLASNELMKSEVGRKVVVLVTDGVDQGSLVKRGTALEAAERADVIVYAVAVSDPAFYWVRDEDFEGEAALARLSSETGGRVVPVDGTRDTAAAFREIAVELHAHYRLGYSPTSGRRDGSFHRIQVRVATGKYKVRTRRGYYARVD